MQLEIGQYMYCSNRMLHGKCRTVKLFQVLVKLTIGLHNGCFFSFPAKPHTPPPTHRLCSSTVTRFQGR